MKKKILVFTMIISAFSLNVLAQKIQEAPAPVDPYFHDPAFYKIQDGMKMKSWNFVEQLEIPL